MVAPPIWSVNYFLCKLVLVNTSCSLEDTTGIHTVKLSNSIFKVLTTLPAILGINGTILGLIYFSLHSTIVGMRPERIVNLRSEAISTIIIAWGVILESRHTLLNGTHVPEMRGNEVEDKLSAHAERSGIFLLIMGLLLEMVTYFDLDVRAEMLPNWIHSTLHTLEWIIIAAIAYELLAHSYEVIKIKYKR